MLLPQLPLLLLLLLLQSLMLPSPGDSRTISFVMAAVAVCRRSLGMYLMEEEEEE